MDKSSAAILKWEDNLSAHCDRYDLLSFHRPLIIHSVFTCELIHGTQIQPKTNLSHSFLVQLGSAKPFGANQNWEDDWRVQCGVYCLFRFLEPFWILLVCPALFISTAHNQPRSQLSYYFRGKWECKNRILLFQNDNIAEVRNFVVIFSLFSSVPSAYSRFVGLFSYLQPIIDLECSSLLPFGYNWEWRSPILLFQTEKLLNRAVWSLCSS